MIFAGPVQMLISQRCPRTQDLQGHGRDTHDPAVKTPCRARRSSSHGERPDLLANEATKKTIAESSNFAAREHLFVVADICLQCTVEEFVAKKLIAGFLGCRR
jgi:hypothetical protein